MDARMQQAPPELPRPGGLVKPYLWSIGLVVLWGAGLVGLMVLALVVRFTGAFDADYDQNQDVALAVSALIQALGGLAVVGTFIALAWIKGRAGEAVRNRFLGYGTIALAACSVVALVALFVLPDGSG